MTPDEFLKLHENTLELTKTLRAKYLSVEEDGGDDLDVVKALEQWEQLLQASYSAWQAREKVVRDFVLLAKDIVSAV